MSHLHVCMCATYIPSAKARRFPGTGVLDVCEPPCEAGNQVWVLCRISNYSLPLSHLQLPQLKKKKVYRKEKKRKVYVCTLYVYACVNACMCIEAGDSPQGPHLLL